MTVTLLDDLTQAASAPAPKDFAPGATYAGRTPETITTPPVEHLETEQEWLQVIKDMGVPIPEGYTVILDEARFDPAAWTRDGQGEDAVTKPLWRYRFKVVLKDARADGDYKRMMAEAAKKVRHRKPLPPAPPGTMVINLSDYQVGKSDVNGGTPELLEANAEAMVQVKARIVAMRPSEIWLLDPGDSTEGFNSVPSAPRTNDLQEAEALRVWRRLFWGWIDMVARFGIPMKVVSVPSNHCRNRQGKQALGPVHDDWGLEVLSQVHDMAGVNPEAYGHVEFIVPRKHEEHVTLTAEGGKVLTVMHGHQAGKDSQLPDKIKQQGRREVGTSDIIQVGHFHHLAVKEFGDNQTLFIAPTMDGGSAYYAASAGERSERGVLTYMVDKNGWRDLFVARP